MNNQILYSSKYQMMNADKEWISGKLAVRPTASKVGRTEPHHF